jgi:hypothetical protein
MGPAVTPRRPVDSDGTLRPDNDSRSFRFQPASAPGLSERPGSAYPAAMPPLARQLGFAGLLPQLAAIAVLATRDPDWFYVALACAYAYAALILSFLGGLWWGLAAASNGRAPAWLWVAAVIPSLFALATAAPWTFGGTWPGPSLVALGAALIATLAVDYRLATLGLAPAGWLKLRTPLSVGLGVLTIAAGLL